MMEPRPRNLPGNEGLDPTMLARKADSAEHAASIQALLRGKGISEKRLFLALMLCLLVDMLGYSLTLPLLPTITKSFTSSDIIIGIVTAANAIFTMIFGPIWGRLSDKHGRKKILFISQVGTLASFVLLGFAGSVEMILLARILDGVFSGQYPIIHAIVADITTPENRAEKISKVMVTVSLSTLFGPLLGGILGAINWRIPPFVTAAISLVSIVLTSKLLIETMPEERRTEIEKAKLEKNMEMKEQRRESKKLNSLARTRLVQVFLVNAVFSIFTSSMALVVGERYQQGPVVIGILLSMMFIFLAIIGGALMLPLRRKFGDLFLTFASIASGVIAWVVFIFAIDIWIYIVYLVFLVFFQAILRPLLTTNLTKTVDRSKQGEISGWATTVQSIAQSTMPLISTGFIEIGQIILLGIVFDSYTLIGILSTAIIIVLCLVLAKDAKNNPESFKFDEAEVLHMMTIKRRGRRTLSM